MLAEAGGSRGRGCRSWDRDAVGRRKRGGGVLGSGSCRLGRPGEKKGGGLAGPAWCGEGRRGGGLVSPVRVRGWASGLWGRLGYSVFFSFFCFPINSFSIYSKHLGIFIKCDMAPIISVTP